MNPLAQPFIPSGTLPFLSTGVGTDVYKIPQNRPGGNRKPKKPFWLSPEGYELYAGGILFYNDEVPTPQKWFVIKENTQHGIKYMDIGGKYQYTDGDIYTTIARELCEETCQTVQVTRDVIVSMALRPDVAKVYVDGHAGLPVYLCLIVPISVARAFYGIQLPSRWHFLSARNRFLSANPGMKNESGDTDWYPIDIDTITHDDPNRGKRLREIFDTYMGIPLR